MQWPANVSGLLDPTTQRFGNAAFNAEVARSFRGNVATLSLRFEPLVPSVPAEQVAQLVGDLKSMERAIGGTMVVSRDQVKDAGFFGIGRKSLTDTLHERATAAVERSGRAIGGRQLGGDDLAQAYCLRAEAQIELGRIDDAVRDAEEAARQAPALSAAWFCRGDAHWAAGRFGEAAADFGKALAFGHDAGETYYRRGHARFYDGKLELAADDFAKAAADRADETAKAYAQLWQAWTLQRLGLPLPAALAAAMSADPRGAWPRPALALFAGRLRPDQVIESIDRRDGDERQLALVEGWFYIGEYELVARHIDGAREAFEKSRAPGITHYIEHTAAGFELQRLGSGAKP